MGVYVYECIALGLTFLPPVGVRDAEVEGHRVHTMVVCRGAT